MILARLQEYSIDKEKDYEKVHREVIDKFRMSALYGDIKSNDNILSHAAFLTQRQEAET